MSAYFFDPGRIQVSPRARAALTEEQQAALLRRHLSGDWDWRQARNELAYLDGEMLFSEYLVRQGEDSLIRVWVVTAADHSRTVVVLPEESAAHGRDTLGRPGALLYDDAPPAER